MINYNLAKERGLSLDVCKAIMQKQAEADWIVLQMLEEDERHKLLNLKLDWTRTQYELQELWGFPLNPDYHRWWYLPKCTCPKMDNDDAYPTGHYVTNASCPLHGEIMNDS